MVSITIAHLHILRFERVIDRALGMLFRDLIAHSDHSRGSKARRHWSGRQVQRLIRLPALPVLESEPVLALRTADIWDLSGTQARLRVGVMLYPQLLAVVALNPISGDTTVNRKDLVGGDQKVLRWVRRVEAEAGLYDTSPHRRNCRKRAKPK